MKQTKKILKWTGIVLGVLLAVLLAVNAWFVSTTHAQLERQIEAIRASGEPMTLATLAPKPIPADENADTYLRQIKTDVEAMSNEVYTDWGKYGVGWENGKLLPPEVVKIVTASFNAHPKVLSLLVRAAACPGYNPPLNYAESSGEVVAAMVSIMQQQRAYARLVDLRVYALVAEGNYEEAAKTALLLLRLARHAESVPFMSGMVFQLTMQGMALDAANVALQSGRVSKEIGDLLDAELAIQEPHDGYDRTIQTDRIGLLDLIPRILESSTWLLKQGILNQIFSDKLVQLGVLQKSIRDKASYSQTVLALRESSEDSQHFYAKLLSNEERIDLLDLEILHFVAVKTQAEIRCLRVLIALQNNPPKDDSKTPNLAQLGLSAETTTDPFNGEPLHITKLPTGWLIYAVGGNLKDDGGNLENKSSYLDGDYGIAPPVSLKKSAKP